MKKVITLCFIAFTLCFSFQFSAFAQTRIAVLPFQNQEGKIDLNVWSYQLQDSLQKALLALDTKQEYFQLVPADSIENLLAELNLDPTNPQYPSDMWKAVASLNVEKVVSGNFYIRAGKLLINAYIYDVRTKLPDSKYQAKNIFKDVEEGMSAIEIIVAKLKPLLIK
jgi:TolB-like protein